MTFFIVLCVNKGFICGYIMIGFSFILNNLALVLDDSSPEVNQGSRLICLVVDHSLPNRKCMREGIFIQCHKFIIAVSGQSNFNKLLKSVCRIVPRNVLKFESLNDLNCSRFLISISSLVNVR